MFYLKRISNFYKHKYFHTLETKVVVITSNTIEIHDRDLNLLQIIDIRDKFTTSVFQDSVFVLTSSHFIILENCKIPFKNDFTKFYAYKNSFLFVGTNKLAVYNLVNDKLKLEWEYKKNFEDIIINLSDIYILENNTVNLYEYYNKILIKKPLNFKIINKSTEKQGLERIILNRRFLSLLDNEMFIVDKKPQFTDGNYFISNHQISKNQNQVNYKIVKQPGLSNIRNIKFNFQYQKDRSNLSVKDLFKSNNFFIKLKNVALGIETDKKIILITNTEIHKYKKDMKISYKGSFIITKVLFANQEFIYYKLNNSFIIYDIETDTKYKYKEREIIDIKKEKNKLAVITNNFMRIYLINNLKYKKIEDIKTEVVKEESLKYQSLKYEDLVFQNTKEGLKIYKDKKFLRRDPICRKILSFYVFDKKIFINDSTQFLIILDFEFIILGMLFIGEIIESWFVENNVLFFKSDIGNISRIKEKEGKRENNYFNFVIETTKH